MTHPTYVVLRNGEIIARSADVMIVDLQTDGTPEPSTVNYLADLADYLDLRGAPGSSEHADVVAALRGWVADLADTDPDGPEPDDDSPLDEPDRYPAEPMDAPTTDDLRADLSGELTYSDHAADNSLRARSAAYAVKAYADRVGTRDEEPGVAIGDLLCDLRHLCDALGLDFDDLSLRGEGHYNAEVTGAVS